MGDHYIREYYGGYKGDTRSLDYSSHVYKHLYIYIYVHTHARMYI